MSLSKGLKLKSSSLSSSIFYSVIKNPAPLNLATGSLRLIKQLRFHGYNSVWKRPWIENSACIQHCFDDIFSPHWAKISQNTWEFKPFQYLNLHAKSYLVLQEKFSLEILIWMASFTCELKQYVSLRKFLQYNYCHNFHI